MNEKYYIDIDTLAYYDNEKFKKSAFITDTDSLSIIQKTKDISKANKCRTENGITLGQSNVNAGKQGVIIFGEQNLAGNKAKSAIVGGKANTANHSYVGVFGRSNIVDGYYGFAANYNNQVHSEAGAAFGAGNVINGAQSFSGGSHNIINNKNAVSFGSGNEINHDMSATLGGDLITGLSNQTVVGYGNEGKSDTRFEVGIGWNTKDVAGYRRNAFEVYTDGRASVYASPIYEKDVVRLKELNKINNALESEINKDKSNIQLIDTRSSNNADDIKQIQDWQDTVYISNPSIRTVIDERTGIFNSKEPTYGIYELGIATGESQIYGGTYLVSMLREGFDPGWFNCYLKIYSGNQLLYHYGYNENANEHIGIGQGVTLKVVIPYTEDPNNIVFVTNGKKIKVVPVINNAYEKVSKIESDLITEIDNAKKYIDEKNLALSEDLSMIEIDPNSTMYAGEYVVECWDEGLQVSLLFNEKNRDGNVVNIGPDIEIERDGTGYIKRFLTLEKDWLYGAAISNPYDKVVIKKLLNTTIQDLTDSKLDKMNQPAGFRRLYAINTEGQQSVLTVASEGAAIVPKRVPFYRAPGNPTEFASTATPTATIPVADPSWTYDAANKKYVDEIGKRALINSGVVSGIAWVASNNQLKVVKHNTAEPSLVGLNADGIPITRAFSSEDITGSSIVQRTGGIIKAKTPDESSSMYAVITKEYAINNLVKKLGVPDNSSVMKFSSVDGSSSYISSTASVIPEAVVERDSAGDIAVLLTPTKVDSAASRDYVDKIFNRVASGSAGAVYTNASGVAKTITVDQGVTSGSIAQRCGEGRLKVGTPLMQNDAATKGYVDETVDNLIYEYESEELDAMFFGTLVDNPTIFNSSEWSGTSNSLYTFQATPGYYRVYADIKESENYDFGVIAIEHSEGLMELYFNKNIPYIDVDVREKTLSNITSIGGNNGCENIRIYLYQGSQEDPSSVPVFLRDTATPDNYRVLLNRKLEDETILDFTQIILSGYIRFNLDANNYVEDWFSYDFTRQCKGIPGDDHLGSFMIHGTFCSVNEKDCPVHTYSAKVTYSLHGNYEFRLHGIEYFRIDNSSVNNGVSCGLMKNIRCRTILAKGIKQLAE